MHRKSCEAPQPNCCPFSSGDFVVVGLLFVVASIVCGVGFCDQFFVPFIILHSSH